MAVEVVEPLWRGFGTEEVQVEAGVDVWSVLFLKAFGKSPGISTDSLV